MLWMDSSGLRCAKKGGLLYDIAMHAKQIGFVGLLFDANKLQCYLIL